MIFIMQGDRSAIGLRIAQCPVRNHLPADLATVSGIGMCAISEKTPERILSNDVFSWCPCKSPRTSLRPVPLLAIFLFVSY